MAKQRPTELSFEQIYDGHAKAIETGFRLFDSGSQLVSGYPDIALGLFQIAQEEIGKSFSLLNAFGYQPGGRVWKEFWKQWRDHDVKSARAFFYEWLCLTRITLAGKDGRSSLDGLSQRGRNPAEKEAAFYVDYHEQSGRFVAPKATIDSYEAFNRGASILSHALIASQLKRALDIGDVEWNYRTFSIIPNRILTQFTLQEEMPNILKEFASQSPRHQELIAHVSEAFSGIKETYSDIVKRSRIPRGISNLAASVLSILKRLTYRSS